MKQLIRYFTLRRRVKNKIKDIEAIKTHLQTSFILTFTQNYYDQKNFAEVKSCEDKIKLLNELL